MESRKMVQINLSARQEERHRCREWTCGHSGGRRGGMSCRVRIDAYTLPRIKQRASGKQLSSVLCDDLDVWDEVGGRSKREGIYVHIQLSPSSRKWQPAPGFLPGKFHGQRNLAGYSPWGHQESDTTELAGIADSGHGTAETNTTF